MSDMQQYRTNPDGTRVPVDSQGRTFEEVRDSFGNTADYSRMLQEGGRISRFMQGLNEALTNPDYQPTSGIGRLVKAMIERGGEGRDGADLAAIVTHGPNGTGMFDPKESGHASTPTMVPEPVVQPSAGSQGPQWNTADAAVAALANGSTSRDDIRALEQATIENLNTMRDLRADSGQIDRALGVMNADGKISGNEYKVFQALIQKSGVDLSAVGISNVKDIDTTQELGQALSAMSQQRSNETQVG